MTLTVALTNAFPAGAIVQFLIDNTDIGTYQQAVFVPFEYAFNVTDGTEITRRDPSSNANDQFGFHFIDGKICQAIAKFRVPYNYSSGIAIKAVIWPAAVGNIYHRILCYFGKVAETWNAATASIAYTAETLAAEKIDEKGKLDSIAVEAGDFLTIAYIRNAGDALDTIGDSVFAAGVMIYFQGASLTGEPTP